MAERTDQLDSAGTLWRSSGLRGHSMPTMLVARTEEEIQRVIAGTEQPSRLFKARVQRHWERWTFRGHLFAGGWVAMTLITMAIAAATGLINADRLGLGPIWFVGGYLGYRLTRSLWPGPFDAYVASRERSSAAGDINRTNGTDQAG